MQSGLRLGAAWVGDSGQRLGFGAERERMLGYHADFQGAPTAPSESEGRGEGGG